MAESAKWYVVHTYSGYEKKVQANIAKVVENRNLGHLIFETKIPTEEVIETKGEERKVVLRQIFPGYVLVKMIMTDESWYVVRNTRGVTGFVGPGSKPVPLTEEEIEKFGVEHKVIMLDFEVGDNVSITEGPLRDFIGTVEEISMDKKKVRVVVNMLGRDTSVDLEFHQVLKF